MTQGFSAPMNFPALLGAYLAVNAIPDAYVLVDGPDCALYKAHFIHGRHDLNSTLLRVDGRHRVCFTNVCARGVAKEHDETVRRGIRSLIELEESGLVLVTALPMCSITGVDYGRIIRSLRDRSGKPVLEIAPEALTGDWLDGYAQTLSALARGLDLRRGRRRRGTAALVGYFMDRNEADHSANLRELRRMMGALSLEVVSVWAGGEGIEALRRVEEAEFVVSLPYGRTAARRVASATGARLVETVLPFGLPKTRRFLEDVGAAASRTDQARAFVDRELSRVIPRLQWIVSQRFLNRKTAFMGDAHLLGGFLDIAEELGLEVEGAIVRGRRPSAGSAAVGTRVLYEPPALSPEVRRLMEAPVDVFVSCWCEQEWPQLSSPVLEFGFPSYRRHVLYEQPFLGFDGFLSFADRMAEVLCRAPGRAHG